MTTLAVTFFSEPQPTAYTDFDPHESQETSRPQPFAGFLTLNGVPGMSKWLSATDTDGKPMNLDAFVRVSPRSETTLDALKAMVSECPGQLLASSFL